MAPVEATVRLHGHDTGRLTFAKGGSTFHYEGGPAILGQVFQESPRSVRRVRVGLPSWFANLLPEGALRRYIARGLGGQVGDIRLLTTLGADLPGAVTVTADGEPEDDLPLPIGGQGLRYVALAGVQLKFSVEAERISLPVAGDGGWWIVKLPDRTFRNLPANEHLMMLWMQRSGFVVPPVRLATAEHVRDLPAGLVAPTESVFLIARFDRTSGGPVHYEDFAQVADVEPAMKYRESAFTYEGLGRVVHLLTGPNGFADYLRRLVAMVLMGNTDAHLKNWAILYPDRITPVLAPVYDFHCTTVYQRYAPLALTLSAEEMPNRIRRDHFRRLAEAAGADGNQAVATVDDTVEIMRAAWAEVRAVDVEFPPLVAHIDERLRSLGLANGA